MIGWLLWVGQSVLIPIIAALIAVVGDEIGKLGVGHRGPGDLERINNLFVAPFLVVEQERRGPIGAQAEAAHFLTFFKPNGVLAAVLPLRDLAGVRRYHAAPGGFHATHNHRADQYHGDAHILDRAQLLVEGQDPDRGRGDERR